MKLWKIGRGKEATLARPCRRWQVWCGTFVVLSLVKNISAAAGQQPRRLLALHDVRIDIDIHIS
jgi:hypothetical protein